MYATVCTVPNTKPRPATPRRERLRPEERRERLLDALLEQVTTDGFGAVSMESIARAGGIAKTVVYNAFGDVDGALGALFEREQERALTAIAASLPMPPFATDPAALATSTLRAILDEVRDHPDSWRLLLVPGPGTPPAVRDAIDAHRSELVARLRPLVVWALAHYGAAELDDELIAYTVVAAVEHAVRLTIEQPDRFDPDRLLGFVTDLAAVVTKRLAG